MLTYLYDNGYSIMQMTCPEASFPDYERGVARMPHGINYYKELSCFEHHCNELGNQVLAQIKAFYNNDYTTIAIMGIEHSPSCAVNYIYTARGIQRKKGLYIHHLAEKISKQGSPIHIIGIDPRFPSKAINSLEKVIHES